MPEMLAKQRLHLRYVDGFRALTATFIVLHHAWLQMWPIDYGESPTGIVKILTGWLLYGRFGVTFFIVISGFCLMLAVAGGDGTLGESVEHGGSISGGSEGFYLHT